MDTTMDTGARSMGEGLATGAPLRALYAAVERAALRHALTVLRRVPETPTFVTTTKRGAVRVKTALVPTTVTASVRRYEHGAGAGELSLLAGTPDVCVRLRVQVQDAQGGTVHLTDAVRDLAPLATGTGTVTLDATRALSVASAMGAHAIDADTGGAPVLATFRAPELRAALDRVDHARSTDDTRPHLCSVLVEWDGNEVALVTTDGHRMAVAYVGRVEDLRATPFAVVLPAAMVPVLRAALRGVPDNERVALHAGSGRKGAYGVERVALVWALGSVQGVYRGGLFPAWRQVVPAESWTTGTRMPFARTALLAAVRGMATRDGSALRLDWVPGTPTAILSSAGADGRRFTQTVPLAGAGCGGKRPFRIGVNARYLADLLAAAPGDAVTLESAGELDPLVVHDGTYVALTMPMRL